MLLQIDKQTAECRRTEQEGDSACQNSHFARECSSPVFLALCFYPFNDYGFERLG